MAATENNKSVSEDPDADNNEQSKRMFSAADVFRDYVTPVFRRPAYIQAGALCLRNGPSGKEVLLITSLTTKRWIIPKGWPMEDRTLGEAAQQEAWEEAGVVGKLYDASLGSFSYRKIMKRGIPVACSCEVFRIDVDHLEDDWPEKGRRERVWVSLAEAAEMVDEPELSRLLRRI